MISTGSFAYNYNYGFYGFIEPYLKDALLNPLLYSANSSDVFTTVYFIEFNRFYVYGLSVNFAFLFKVILVCYVFDVSPSGVFFPLTVESLLISFSSISKFTRESPNFLSSFIVLTVVDYIMLESIIVYYIN